MKKMSEAQKINGWKIAMREAIQVMSPAGVIEIPGNKFLVMFDRKLSEQEEAKLEILKFKHSSTVYAYTYNPKAKLKGVIKVFDAAILATWDSTIIYDKPVDQENLRGIMDLNFRFKTLIELYEASYE